MSQSGATREWSLLVAACACVGPSSKADRIRELCRGALDWKTVIGLADRHGVLPLLGQALAQQEASIPPDALGALNEGRQANTIKSLLVARELIRILDHLKQRNLDVIPYKGPVLAQLAYGDIALRKSGDIDLLIRASQFRAVCSAATELGFTPHLHLSSVEEKAYLQSGYEYSFDGAAGPNLLEVQWAIQPRFYSVAFDVEGLFDRAIEIEVAGQPMKTLSTEDLILVLSVHAAKHVWGRLVWLSDIARLASCLSVDWNWTAAQASKLGASRIMQVTFLLCSQLLEPAAYSEIANYFPSDEKSSMLADELQNHLLSQSEYNVDSLAYFRLMLSLRERIADRVRFVQRLLLTPGPGEWQVVSLPSALFPLYRVIRLARVSARLARA